MRRVRRMRATGCASTTMASACCSKTIPKVPHGPLRWVEQLAPERLDGCRNLARVAVRDGHLERAYEHLEDCEALVSGNGQTAWVWGWYCKRTVATRPRRRRIDICCATSRGSGFVAQFGPGALSRRSL